MYKYQVSSIPAGERVLMKEEIIAARVHEYYWFNDYNCAITMLKILSEKFVVNLNRQVINAAIGMHGAGKYRAQCGLVEGALMFIGIYGKEKSYSDDEIADKCYSFALAFENQFGSLLCRNLRPGGFTPEDQPHMCEELTIRAVIFSAGYITDAI
jgi:C_GCAxxG_C_C family probable redox protein